ncbi:hypothetical protein ACFYWY_36360 [Streptomyces sp. NPDC002870]|uniref:hypothetical protein n=1 Tax=Streptomyces sp. NPDC002870 TaxID=3364666 RepID=UPI00368506D1
MTGTVPSKLRQPSRSSPSGATDQPWSLSHRPFQHGRDASRIAFIRFNRALGPTSSANTKATDGKPPRPESSHSVDHIATSRPRWSFTWRWKNFW